MELHQSLNNSDASITMDDVAEEMEVDEPNYPDYSRQRRLQNHPSHQLYFNSSVMPNPPLSEDIKLKSQIRERRHAALSILADSELLMFHAVKNNETIPQARHRLQHHLIGVNNPENSTIAFVRCDNLHNISSSNASRNKNSENYTTAFGLQDDFHDLTPITPPTPHPPLYQSVSNGPPSAAATADGSSSGLHRIRLRHPGVKAGEHGHVSEKLKLKLPLIDIIEVGDGWTREEEVHRGGQSTPPRVKAAKAKGTAHQQHYPVAEGSNQRRQT